MIKKITLKAIVVANTVDKAKQIAQTIGKTHYALKGKIASSLEDLSIALASQAWDAVLISDELPTELSLDLITHEINQLGQNTLTLLLANIMNDDIRTQAMQQGAGDALSINSPKLLALILTRELSNTVTNHNLETTAPRPQKINFSNSNCDIDLNNLTPEDKRWSERIKAAMNDNRFFTVFQPIVNLNAEPAANYEILLRMSDEDGSEISPGIFLASAEKSYLMSNIDRWVIQHSVNNLLKQQKEEPNTRFFIKLSTQSLLDDNLIPWLNELIYSSKVPEESLVFELTEADSLKYEQQTKKLIKNLRQLKCQITLDHIGANGSQSNQWQVLAPDYIKLSGQLIRNITNNKKDQDTVVSISGYAKSHKILTIAQFVQDPTTLAFLWQRGINYIQGYYLQRPDTSLNYDFSQEDNSQPVAF